MFDGDIPDLGNGISGTGLTANQRPNLVSGADCNASGSLKEQFLNPAAFTLVGIPFGTFGNSPRGVCLGPGFFQTDLAFYKNIPLGGHVQGQFRIEIFNVFNRVNFTGLDTSLNPIDVTYNTGDPSTATSITAFTPLGVVRAGAGHPRSEAGAVRLQADLLDRLVFARAPRALGPGAFSLDEGPIRLASHGGFRETSPRVVLASTSEILDAHSVGDDPSDRRFPGGGSPARRPLPRCPSSAARSSSSP